jgi:hypothetical protein
MSESLPAYRRAFNYLQEAKATIAGSLGILAVNLMYGDSLVVHSDDPITKQLEMAVPSAFGTPDATGNAVLDFAGVTGYTLISLEAARRTTSLQALAAMGVSAQLVSCGTDALVDQTGWIAGATDSGSSAMGMAWMTKVLLDRTASAEDKTKKRRWKMATTALVGSLTLGAYLWLGDDGKLDMISHGSAFAVGVAGYKLGAWRKRHQQEDAVSPALNFNPELESI